MNRRGIDGLCNSTSTNDDNTMTDYGDDVEEIESDSKIYSRVTEDNEVDVSIEARSNDIPVCMREDVVDTMPEQGTDGTHMNVWDQYDLWVSGMLISERGRHGWRLWETITPLPPVVRQTNTVFSMTPFVNPGNPVIKVNHSLSSPSIRALFVRSSQHMRELYDGQPAPVSNSIDNNILVRETDSGDARDLVDTNPEYSAVEGQVYLKFVYEPYGSVILEGYTPMRQTTFRAVDGTHARIEVDNGAVIHTRDPDELILSNDVTLCIDDTSFPFTRVITVSEEQVPESLPDDSRNRGDVPDNVTFTATHDSQQINFIGEFPE